VADRPTSFQIALGRTWPGLRYLSLGVWMAWLFLTFSGAVWLSDVEVNGEALAKLMIIVIVSSAVVSLVAPMLGGAVERLLASQSFMVGMALLAAAGAGLIIAAGPYYTAIEALFIAGCIFIGVFSGIFSLRCGQLFGQLESKGVLLYSLFGEVVVVALSCFVISNNFYAPVAGGPSLIGILAFALLPLLATLAAYLPGAVGGGQALGGQDGGQAQAGGGQGSVPEASGGQGQGLAHSPAAAAGTGAHGAAADGAWPPAASVAGAGAGAGKLSASFYKLLLLIIFFTVASEMLRCYFVFVRMPALTHVDSMLVLLLRLAFAVVMLVFALRFSRQLRFGRMYQVALVALVLLTALVPVLAAYNIILGSLIGLVSSVMNFMFWCIMSTMVYDGKGSALAVFGYGRGALLLGQAGGWLLGIKVLPQLEGTGWDRFSFWGIAILILAVMVLFFSDRHLDNLFEDVARNRIRLSFPPASESRPQVQRPWHEACRLSGERAMLSPREQEIFELLASGRVPDNIAAQMSLSLNTVRTHTRSIYAKLDVHSRAELVAHVERVLKEEVAAPE